jgi:hypothetical protein
LEIIRHTIVAMKKSSTWYLFTLAALNVLLALGTSYSADLWTDGYRRKGIQLPEATLLAIESYCWPCVFAGLMFVLALVSFRSQWPDVVFFHFMIWLLVTECFILFAQQIFFVLPLIELLSNLK